ncbi:MAG: hypothetical protein ACW963_07895 [Candidatus Sifarchaeia archaeon]
MNPGWPSLTSHPAGLYCASVVDYSFFKHRMALALCASSRAFSLNVNPTNSLKWFAQVICAHFWCGVHKGTDKGTRNGVVDLKSDHRLPYVH